MPNGSVSSNSVTLCSPSFYIPLDRGEKKISSGWMYVWAFHPSDTLLHICWLVLSATQSLLICSPSVFVSLIGARKSDRRLGACMRERGQRKRKKVRALLAWSLHSPYGNESEKVNPHGNGAGHCECDLSLAFRPLHCPRQFWINPENISSVGKRRKKSIKIYVAYFRINDTIPIRRWQFFHDLGVGRYERYEAGALATQEKKKNERRLGL